MKPRIYADFQNLDDDNRVRLNTVGTRRDLEQLGIELSEGMELLLYTDDADEAGQPDDLMVDAVTLQSAEGGAWVAEANWSTLRHASEETRQAERNGAPAGHLSSAKTA